MANTPRGMTASFLLRSCGSVLLCALALAAAASAQQTGAFKDPRDGRTYRTITIGGRTWMAENLAFKAKGGCHVYGWDADNKKANAAKYGYLYEWKAARKACPPGWHLPTKDEWDELVAALGGEPEAGAAMKSPKGWGGSDGGPDAFGFSALPGGYRDDSGSFDQLGRAAYWWTSTESDRYTAFCWSLHAGSPQLHLGTYGKSAGGAMSIRCVMD